MKFFVFILLFLCRLNFTLGEVPEELSRGNFERVGIIWDIFPRGWDSPLFGKTPPWGNFLWEKFSITIILHYRFSGVRQGISWKNYPRVADFWHDLKNDQKSGKRNQNSLFQIKVGQSKFSRLNCSREIFREEDFH